MLKPHLLPWHRRLAWIVALPLLAWSLSGLLHPLMSRWQPSAAEMRPPLAMLLPPPTTAWADLPPAAATVPADWPLRELRVMTWQDEPFWLAQTVRGERFQVQARTGELKAIEAEMMTALARHYTGEHRAAVSLSEVSAFSSEYPAINRYLPVIRVAFDRPDGLVAFIEPRSLRLAALSDTWKTRFSGFFRSLHTWSWWPHAPSRAMVMSLFLGLGVLVVIAGLLRLSPRRAGQVSRPPLPRVHRWLGTVVALGFLAWLTTGALHSLVMQDRRGSWPTQIDLPAFSSATLTRAIPDALLPQGPRQLISTHAGPVWYGYEMARPGPASPHHHGPAQAAPALKAVYLAAGSGEVIDPLPHWLQLARPVAGARTLQSVQAVTAFDHEYGFVQKRLPVQRLRFEGHDGLTVYVDPAHGSLATVVRTLDRVEGYAFAKLHKTQFLDDVIGKTARDAVAALFAAGVFVLTLTGLLLWRRRSPASAGNRP